MSHVKLNSLIHQTAAQEKATALKLERFSDAVTVILRGEAAAKMKKLMYVFVTVHQRGPASFTCEVDDSRDKISKASRDAIKIKFEELFKA